MRIAITVFAVALCLIPLAGGPHAGEDEGSPNRAPETLVIGYEGEGTVDASEAACTAFVAEMVEWGPEETKQAIRDVCEQRQKHVDAYARLMRTYGAFAKVFNEDLRLEVAAAVGNFASLVRSCIEMKTNLGTGGHNIGTDMMPNAIAAQCLDLGSELLAAETKRYTDP